MIADFKAVYKSVNMLCCPSYLSKWSRNAEVNCFAHQQLVSILFSASLLNTVVSHYRKMVEMKDKKNTLHLLHCTFYNTNHICIMNIHCSNYTGEGNYRRKKLYCVDEKCPHLGTWSSSLIGDIGDAGSHGGSPCIVYTWQQVVL